MFLTNGKLYAYYLGGHTVLIVGCSSSADKFLYIDPWAGGSKLKYEGAPADAGLGVCTYLGMFEAIYDRARAVEMPIISQYDPSNGGFRGIVQLDRGQFPGSGVRPFSAAKAMTVGTLRPCTEERGRTWPAIGRRSRAARAHCV